MADRRDIDDWLSERVNPLPPPPGTFELIKRRARRRKIRRLAITATSAAVIVAAAVTVPQVVNLPVLNPNPTSATQAGRSGTATPTSQGHTESSSATPQPSASSLPASASVPANFRPTSVTFIGTGTGWVIGQASTPGHCATQYCTSMARTDNAGRTWTGVPAPVTGAPDGATGVSQVRFLNLTDGWAFGPELWVTHTGGQTWTQVNTHGLRVTDLETVGGRAFALFASCTGSGLAFAGGCTSFTLYSSPASGQDWTPVGAATTGLTDSTADGAAGEAASLVLTGSRGYLLTTDGTLYSGPVDGSAAWRKTGSLPDACQADGTGASAQPNGAQPNGAQPNGALLGAANASDLLLTCLIPRSGSNPAERKLVYSSPNRGASWLILATAPPAGIAASLAASPSESLVLATDRGIELLPKGEIAWQTATLTSPAPAGGFSYVGMTTDDQGIALPADPDTGAVWFTFDGGQTWKPSAVTNS